MAQVIVRYLVVANILIDQNWVVSLRFKDIDKFICLGIVQLLVLPNLV